MMEPYGIPEPTEPPPNLPFFEAALASSRGSTQPNPDQMPSYLPPPDPNHPDIAIGFARNQSVRTGYVARSRSPSPERVRNWEHPRDDEGLLDAGDYRPSLHSPYLPLDEKDIDLALPPFQGAITPPRLLSALPSMYRKVNHADSEEIDDEGDLAGGVTKHFGPAPTGRIGRRTHNADHRRIKHTATLDDNGFFAIDMPIPTRLAQFLPFKGVEEQKTTR